jgi:lipopolysaccharide/colanic/teichoic acid biosynthesis glycosyltransferase
MKIKGPAQPLLLLFGDIIVLFFSLWATLLIRYTETPSSGDFMSHLVPFSFIFIIWFLVYFIYDFYSNQTTIMQQQLSSLLLSAHIVNSVIALAFFYLIPYFAITPKTTLFIFLIISFFLLQWWRLHIIFLVTRGEEDIVFFATSGAEVDEIIKEFEMNPLYRIRILEKSDIEGKGFFSKPLVVINTHDSNTSSFVDFYNMLFSGARFVTLDSLYETIFGREPIGSISERWFLESISTQSKLFYDFIKRFMDITISFILGLISLIIYPFVYLAIKLEDGGPIFITQERVGENNILIKTYKFRSMTKNVTDLERGGDNQVTKVGDFLRRTRIDELPQLWSVLKGDMSLIGPRPELPSGVQFYSRQIPYYAVRHLIKPGLSGWAQIYGEHSHHSIGLAETKNKLSYDLYYIKNRNVFLDIKITLKTIRILLSRSGV